MGKISDLPADILSDILSRIPTESVLECKLVSKPWRNLISRPSFSQLHLNRFHAADYSGKLGFIFKNDGLLYTEYDEISNTCTKTASTKFRPDPAIITDHYVLGSCNGLICFNASYYEDRTQYYQYYEYQPGDEYFNYEPGDEWIYYQPAYICNPVTREYVILPRLRLAMKVMSGFGYIPSTNVYKVVRMCYLPDQVKVEVYTLGSGQGWRDVGNLDHAIQCYEHFHDGVFANGALHWFDYTRETIFAFDLADEKFSQFPKPPFLPERSSITLSLGFLGDFLCATYGYDDRFVHPAYRCCDEMDSFDVWLLKKNKDDHGMSWIKQCNLGGYEPFAFTKSGGYLCYGYVDENSDKTDICHYDPKAASSPRMLLRCGFSKDCRAVLHKNTLVGLKALGETDTKIMECGETARPITDGRGARSKAQKGKKSKEMQSAQ